MASLENTATDFSTLAVDIKTWGTALGFQQIGISDIDLSEAEHFLDHWLEKGHHGDMDYMQVHGRKRSRPAELVPGTTRVISARMEYWPSVVRDSITNLRDKQSAFISRYALGRDYHKLMRRRLQKLAERISDKIGTTRYRVFTDSAPVLEKALAAKAGLGWIGKHTNLLTRSGSWFFLGEIYTDLPLPTDEPVDEHCGRCRACLDICPTGAIIAPYQLDARRCISYLTIELRGPIPVELRPLIGNRIYGCDDCQLVCPWNRFARPSEESDFQVRHRLDTTDLVDFFGWDEATFLRRTEGSAIRRVGYEGWLRNIAVALGNAPTTNQVVAALSKRAQHPSELVREHVEWALGRHGV